MTEAQKKAQQKSDKSNTRQVVLKLNVTSDADILAKLDSVDNRQGYIKSLIREQMRKDEQMTIDTIRMLIQPIARKYKIRRISLFGSFARGEEDRLSDVDLLIEGGDFRGLLEFSDMKDRFSEALGRNVDLVMAEAMQKDQSRSGKRFRENVEKDKIVVYEQYENI